MISRYIFKLFPKLLTAFIVASGFCQAEPPVVSAVGDQIYCPQTEQNIVTAFNIVDNDSNSTSGFYIQISSGYAFGEDQLSLTGSHPNIVSSWNAAQAKLTLSPATGSSILYTDIINAVNDVVFFSTNINVEAKTFSLTIGEANFSDHGANRLGASALMQGLADGYFVAPYTVGEFLSKDIRTGTISTDSPEFEEAEKAVRERTDKFINNNGTKSVDHFHKRLGKIMWNEVGMARNEKGLKQAIADIQALREEFYADVRVLGAANGMNPELDKAGRVADLIELGELMAKDALERNESCGGHFREEYQSEEGEALRDDENFTFVSAWEFTGVPAEANLHKEELTFENVELKTRSYK